LIESGLSLCPAAAPKLRKKKIVGYSVSDLYSFARMMSSDGSDTQGERI